MDELHPRIRTALAAIQPTADNPAYHGCPTALGVLRGVSAKAAVWRPYAGANNIREIALHLAYYENSVANRLSGNSAQVGFKQRKSGWAEMLDEISQEQWKEELDLIKTIHQRMVDAVTAFDPALLDQVVGNNTKHPATYFLYGVAEHTLYHAAQLEMLKKLAERNGI